MFRSTPTATAPVDPRRIAALGADVARDGAGAHEDELAEFAAHARRLVGRHIAIDVLVDPSEREVVRARSFDRVAGLVVAAQAPARPRRAVSRSRRRPSPDRSAASLPGLQAALSSRPGLR